MCVCVCVGVSVGVCFVCVPARIDACMCVCELMCGCLCACVHVCVDMRLGMSVCVCVRLIFILALALSGRLCERGPSGQGGSLNTSHSLIRRLFELRNPLQDFTIRSNTPRVASSVNQDTERIHLKKSPAAPSNSKRSLWGPEKEIYKKKGRTE